MSAVFSSLLGAGLSALASRDAVNDQNRFNIEMYERYKTPMAQARQLRQEKVGLIALAARREASDVQNLKYLDH